MNQTPHFCILRAIEQPAAGEVKDGRDDGTDKPANFAGKKDFQVFFAMSVS